MSDMYVTVIVHWMLQIIPWTIFLHPVEHTLDEFSVYTPEVRCAM